MHWRYAAHRGVAQQARDAGRARHADQHRNADAARAQCIQPGQHGIGIEGELGGDHRRHAARFDGLALAFRVPASERRRSSPDGLRMPADTYDLDAETLKTPGLDDRSTVGKRPGRRREVTGDQQAALHPGFAGGALRKRSSAVRDPMRRAERCGIGSNPSARTVRTAARRASSSSLASQGMEMTVPRGIRSASARSAGMAFALTSSEKALMKASACAGTGRHQRASRALPASGELLRASSMKACR